MASASSSSETAPQPLPLRRQSAPSIYFNPQRRASTPTGGLAPIPERTPTMVPIDDESAPVVVEPPKGNTLHHLPIAFALLPACAGLFVGGGEKWTDVMLLGLAGVYLNWLVKFPWEWYHASRMLRLMSDSQASPLPFFTHTQASFVAEPESNISSSAIASEDESDGGSTTPTLSQQPPAATAAIPPHHPDIEAAAHKLRRTELLALTCCVLSPLIGGYLLHYIREFLSRPSEGLVSTFNITLFVMAAELRPALKLMEMIKQRSLHLQKVVHRDMLEGTTMTPFPAVDIEPLNAKIEGLEGIIEDLRMAITRVQGGREEVVTGVREGIRADVEALNRAVRRYEKNFALHRAHTEDRINLLSSRVNDLSLIVSDSTHSPHSLLNLILSVPESILHLIHSLLSLPKVIFFQIFRGVFGTNTVVGEKGGAGGLKTKTSSSSLSSSGKGTKSPTKRRVVATARPE